MVYILFGYATLAASIALIAVVKLYSTVELIMRVVDILVEEVLHEKQDVIEVVKEGSEKRTNDPDNREHSQWADHYRSRFMGRV